MLYVNDVVVKTYTYTYMSGKRARMLELHYKHARMRAETRCVFVGGGVCACTQALVCVAPSRRTGAGTTYKEYQLYEQLGKGNTNY